jgi:hypothetical protein
LRYFLRSRIPPFERVLLVESGSRSILNKLIPVIRERINPATQIDLVTCYPGTPDSFNGRVFRVTDYSSSAARGKLLAQLAAQSYSVTGLICSGEPIMTKWKWMIALRVPAKVFLINEHSDFLFFDWPNRQQVLHLWKHRSGLGGTAAIGTFAGLLLLPFSLCYLLAFAGWVHLKRWVRLRTAPPI